MSTSPSSTIASASLPPSAPGENFEVRQTHPSEDYTPNPSKSLPLSPARQALIDDIIELYSCHPTVRRVERYTPDCVYDDQFVYANDRYKMAGQWFALPKLFKKSKNEGYQVVVNEEGLIQFRNAQVCVVIWGVFSFLLYFREIEKEKSRVSFLFPFYSFPLIPIDPFSSFRQSFQFHLTKKRKRTIPQYLRLHNEKHLFQNHTHQPSLNPQTFMDQSILSPPLLPLALFFFSS